MELLTFLNKGQKTEQATLFNYQIGEGIIDRLFDGYGETQLREIVTGGGHRYWHIVYVDEHGVHGRGFSTRFCHAKKAFNKAGRRTWV